MEVVRKVGNGRKTSFWKDCCVCVCRVGGVNKKDANVGGFVGDRCRWSVVFLLE